MTLKLTPLLTALVIATSSAMAADGAVIGKASEQITIKGDLRLRHETRDRDRPAGGDSRNRLRTRFRLGVDFETDYGWTVHAGLATGGSDGTSTNDTWNEGSGWETGDIRLDYAYAQHVFESNTKVTVGQHKNPYKNAGIFWDSDLRPTGLTAQQKFGIGFVTTGYYNLAWQANETAHIDMAAIQGGISDKTGSMNYTVALALYHLNSQADSGPSGDYTFSFINLYADFGIKVNTVDISAFAEAGQNLGADSSFTQVDAAAPANYDSEDNNTHYTLGVQAKAAGFKVKAQYVHLEGDSAIEGLTNSDFGDGIDHLDTEGYILGISYGITKNCSIGATVLAAESIERPDEKATITQLDLKYKF